MKTVLINPVLHSRFVGKMNPDRRVRLGVDCLVTHRENLATEVIIPDFAFLVAHSSESKHHTCLLLITDNFK